MYVCKSLPVPLGCCVKYAWPKALWERVVEDALCVAVNAQYAAHVNRFVDTCYQG